MAKQRQRRRRSAQFKFQVALEALKEQQTLSQLASEYDVHPTQIVQWKKQLLDGGTSLFVRIIGLHVTLGASWRCSDRRGASAGVLRVAKRHRRIVVLERVG